MLSNLDETLAVHNTVGDGGEIRSQAVRFITDSSAAGFSLQGVTLKLGGSAQGNGFSVSIYSHSNNLPATLLEILTGSSAPSPAGNYYYTSANLQLAPDTSYWIVANSQDPSTSYGWAKTSSSSFLYEGDWKIPTTITTAYGVGLTNNVTWYSSYDGTPFQFSINAIPIPEPSTTVILLGAGAILAIAYRRRNKTLP